MPPASDARLEQIERHLRQSAAVKRQSIAACSAAILTVADLIAHAFRAGRKLLICGNGGSAADSQHLAAEFTSRLSASFHRPALPALALTTDTSFLTAYANDFNFQGIFARQIEALGQSGDVLLGISTSGHSPNVIRAIQTASQLQMETVALTGRGGPLSRLARFAVCVPSEETHFIQETHLAIEHLLCHLVERALFDGAADASATAATCNGSAHAPG